MGEILTLSIVAIFVNNIVLAQFLGLCPFFGVSKKLDSALGMGFAVIFVMTLASLVTWLLWSFVLVPLELYFLDTIVFILVIASLVQFVEMTIRKTVPVLYQALGIFLPLITTNCAILGVAQLNIIEDHSFITAIFFGLFSGVGFTLALLLMAGIREKLELADIPAPFKGLPIAFIAASLLSLAFLGFSGMFVQ